MSDPILSVPSLLRLENEKMQHTIPLNTLVEVQGDDQGLEDVNGIRAFVIEHERDCDGSPLYRLSLQKGVDKYQEVCHLIEKGILHPVHKQCATLSGFSEDCLHIV